MIFIPPISNDALITGARLNDEYLNGGLSPMDPDYKSPTVDPIVDSLSIDSKTKGSDEKSIFDILNDWYSNIESADVAANKVAQANATAAQTYNTSERLAAEAFNENAYKHRYQWTYDDMKAAGINPIIGLASMGVGSAPTSSPASVSAAQTFMRQKNLLDDWLPLFQVLADLFSSVTGAFKK